MDANVLVLGKESVGKSGKDHQIVLIHLCVRGTW